MGIARSEAHSQATLAGQCSPPQAAQGRAQGCTLFRRDSQAWHRRLANAQQSRGTARPRPPPHSVPPGAARFRCAVASVAGVSCDRPACTCNCRAFAAVPRGAALPAVEAARTAPRLRVARRPYVRVAAAAPMDGGALAHARKLTRTSGIPPPPFPSTHTPFEFHGFAACCTLDVACCTLDDACCMLHVAFCKLDDAGCMFHAAVAGCWVVLHPSQLFNAARCMLRTPCCLFHVARCTSHAAYRKLGASRMLMSHL
jgi:hypothetical protein